MEMRPNITGEHEPKKVIICLNWYGEERKVINREVKYWNSVDACSVSIELAVHVCECVSLPMSVVCLLAQVNGV